MSASGALPSDKYDELAVISAGYIWRIPASMLDGKEGITIRVDGQDCPYRHFKRKLWDDCKQLER